MAYTGYYTNDELRKKLGNTIAGNFDENLLTNARKYGDDWVDSRTFRTPLYQDATDSNVIHGWTVTDPFYNEARGISFEIAVCWIRTTQINVSIQAQREYAQAEKDAAALYQNLIALGLVQKTGRFAVDNFVTDVLNPITGTRVTGLRGIVASRRLLYGPDLW